jgi:hypothetical protein
VERVNEREFGRLEVLWGCNQTGGLEDIRRRLRREEGGLEGWIDLERKREREEDVERDSGRI